MAAIIDGTPEVTSDKPALPPGVFPEHYDRKLLDPVFRTAPANPILGVEAAWGLPGPIRHNPGYRMDYVVNGDPVSLHFSMTHIGENVSDEQIFAELERACYGKWGAGELYRKPKSNLLRYVLAS